MLNFLITTPQFDEEVWYNDNIKWKEAVMDKITRMLILYSSLMNGEEINKTIFCFENDCSPRSFDRDIEDIRLFLSESFSVLELNYNRVNNNYYIKGAKRQQMEVMEYLFIEKILQDASVLRNDEFGILKNHLLMNTRDSSKMITSPNKDYVLYKPPEHNKALLKIHGDLELAIRNQKYIRMVYQDDLGTKHMCDVAPCAIRYKVGNLYFIGYIENESKFLSIELERVYSFEILREQTISERKRVDAYMRESKDNIFAEFHNNPVEIILECTPDDYEVLHNVFENGEVLRQGKELFKIRLSVNEDTFIYRYLTYCPETVTVIEPQHVKERLISQAQKILKKYGGRG